MRNGLKKHYHNYDHQNCFVGSSYKAPWHDDIISACEETLPKFGLQPWYADDQFEPTKSLRDKVVEMVANARYGLYDLSWWRSDEQSAWKMPQNVLIELGMAIALNRPVLMLRHAENCVAGLQLPTCLDSQQIVEFSGEYTLKRALEERLPQWLDVPSERAWWKRYCLFGQRICTYRESYPQAEQYRQELIHCHISDGQDTDRDDFRYMIESELGRYSDISYDYLDSLAPATGYDFLLCTHCQMVRSTPFAIYRITPQTPAETFVAIGMSIALEKQFKCEIPKFIFTTDAHSVPSLLSGYEVVETKTTKEREKRLRRFLPIVMRKVRENVWKPGPLPFAEFLPPTTEASLSEKDQALFSDAEEEIAFPDSEEHFSNALDQSTDNIEIDDANELALKKLEKDIRLYPNNARIYNDKGEVVTRLERYEEALSAYNKAIELEPDNPTFYYNRGQCYLAQKKYKQAFEDFEMTVSLNPDYSDARRQRDMLWDLLSSSLNMPFHQRLKRERELRGLSQEELAGLIDTTSVTIRRWESGITVPAHYFSQRLSQLFNKTEEELGLRDSSNKNIVPFQYLEDDNEENNQEEQQRCERVINQLTPRRLEILRAFAEGSHPAEVAEKLSISMPTVSTHTTVLLSLCRDVWPMREKERLDYRFFQLKFEKYFEGHDQLEDE